MTAIAQSSHDLYARLGQAAAKTVDLDQIEALACSGGNLEGPPSTAAVTIDSSGSPPVRVGVAHDSAFCFYYTENLELLEAEGAELVMFSPLRDQVLPEVDLLYLGGGYPELHGEALSNNVAMRTAIRRFAARGGTIYAECGGMMYLTRGIRDFDGRVHEMVGLFPADAVMHRSSMTLGYRELEITRPCILGEPGVRAKGHEFHYSSLVPTARLEYGCRLTDANGLVLGQDGLMAGYTLALYTHLHFGSQPKLAQELIASVRKRKAVAVTCSG